MIFLQMFAALWIFSMVVTLSLLISALVHDTSPERDKLFESFGATVGTLFGIAMTTLLAPIFIGSVAGMMMIKSVRL